MILNAKCHAIRDAQLIEKVDIKKEQLEEEKRLDEMMEVERLKALQEYEEREKAAHMERLVGAQVLQKQITEREQLRLLDEEKKDQETKVSLCLCRVKARMERVKAKARMERTSLILLHGAVKSTASCSLKWLLVYHKVNKFLVSRETVVLGYLERET